MRVLEGLEDSLQDGVRLGQCLVVPEVQNPIAASLQEGCPPAIRVSLHCMLTAVEFDHETPLGTAEVNDERPDRMLPPELGASNLTVTETGPQLALGVSLTSAQLASTALRRGLHPSP